MQDDEEVPASEEALEPAMKEMLGSNGVVMLGLDGADFFASKQGSVLGSKAVIAVLLPPADLFERVSGMLLGTPLQTEPNAA